MFPRTNLRTALLDVDPEEAMVIAGFYTLSFAQYAHLSPTELHDLAVKQPILLEPIPTLGVQLPERMDQLARITRSNVDIPADYEAIPRLLDRKLITERFISGKESQGPRGQMFYCEVSVLFLADYIDLMVLAGIYPASGVLASARRAEATHGHYARWIQRRMKRKVIVQVVLPSLFMAIALSVLLGRFVQDNRFETPEWAAILTAAFIVAVLVTIDFARERVNHLRSDYGSWEHAIWARRAEHDQSDGVASTRPHDSPPRDKLA